MCALGAKFEDVGLLINVLVYPQANETMQTPLNRECIATREFRRYFLDASTYGKIDIQGKDAP